LYQLLYKYVKEPEFVFEEGSYIVFEEPKDNRLYIAGVDISEGIGDCASVIQILDVTDMTNIEQVAVYHNKNIIPYQFTAKLYEILNQWGKPPVGIERNSCGAQVVEQLKFTHGYENIVSWGAKAGDIVERKRVGILSHTNTKYRGVTNMRYWLNELKAVKLRDINTLKEIKNFIRFPNNTWSARPGNDSFDDRVMSLIWALIILENEICVKYFDVAKLDDCDRPLILKPLDFGVKGVISPLSLYVNERDGGAGGSSALPIVFTENPEDAVSDEIKFLEQQGWRPLGIPTDS
jgi:hypothetical protein